MFSEMTVSYISLTFKNVVNVIHIQTLPMLTPLFCVPLHWVTILNQTSSDHLQQLFVHGQQIALWSALALAAYEVWIFLM